MERVISGGAHERLGIKRVAIVGSGGAGKSVLARRLGATLGLPVYHLDKLLWKKGWVMSSDEEEQQIQPELVCRDRWIIDGNYGRTMPLRLEAADTIVFLDMPRWRCMLGILSRYFSHIGRTRADMADGCPEDCDWEFMMWVWNFPQRSRPLVLERIAKWGQGKRVYILRSRRQAEQFLEDLGRKLEAGT